MGSSSGIVNKTQNKMFSKIQLGTRGPIIYTTDTNHPEKQRKKSQSLPFFVCFFILPSPKWYQSAANDGIHWLLSSTALFIVVVEVAVGLVFLTLKSFGGLSLSPSQTVRSNFFIFSYTLILPTGEAPSQLFGNPLAGANY